VLAGFIATAVIFVLGEITPQAVFSRHALLFGGFSAPLVRIAMVIFYPVTFPIAYILDRALGTELPHMYSKSELMHIISEHENSEHSIIDADEERILHGALKFSHRRVKEVMTPLEKVAMFDIEQKLTPQFFEEVASLGYSRYPVYQKKRSNVVGILYTKDLLVEDENISIKNTEEALETTFMKVKSNTLLDEVLSRMLKQKRHLAIVYDVETCVGVITLEDIIEEIIQYEIQDEDDIGAGKENVTPPLSVGL
jgi:metal transporter CNNM